MELNNLFVGVIRLTCVLLLFVLWGCKNPTYKDNIASASKKEAQILPESLSNNLVDTTPIKKSAYKKIEPHAAFIFASSQSTTTSITSIRGLRVSHDIDSLYHDVVESFKLMIKRDNKKIAYFTNPKSYFSKEILEFNHEKARLGDVYVFYDIRFRLRNGEIMMLPTLELSVR